MNGAGDPDNRHFMQWNGYTANQTWLHDQLAGAREAARASTRPRAAARARRSASTTDTFVYKMAGAGDTIFVALNRGDSAQPARRACPPAATPISSPATTVTTPISIPPRTGLVLIAQ